MGLVFVKPRFFYESFTDFWMLVSLSDFDWCWMDEIDQQANNTYIVTSVDFKRDKWESSWWQRKRRRARVIFWDLERPHPRGGRGKAKKLLQRQYFDEVWCSDYQLARDMKARFVILGSDKNLGKKQKKCKSYNFAPMCYVNGRRGAILENLNQVAPNAWGKKRQDILRSSKFGLTIHQDNDLYQEPLRLALFASYGLPIISENIYDPFPLTGLLLISDYDNLIDLCGKCIEDYKSLAGLGIELQQRLCVDYRFKNVVEYAVKN